MLYYDVPYTDSLAEEKQRLLNKVESALAKKAVEVIREMEKQLMDKAKTVDPDELDIVALELLNDAAVAKGGKDLASYLSANVTQYAEFGMAVSRVRAMAAEHKKVEEERRKVEEEKRAALEREAAVKEEMRKAKAEKDAELEEMRQTINDLKEAQQAGGSSGDIAALLAALQQAQGPPAPSPYAPEPSYDSPWGRGPPEPRSHRALDDLFGGDSDSDSDSGPSVGRGYGVGYREPKLFEAPSIDVSRRSKPAFIVGRDARPRHANGRYMAYAEAERLGWQRPTPAPTTRAVGGGGGGTSFGSSGRGASPGFTIGRDGRPRHPNGKFMSYAEARALGWEG